MSVMVCLLPFLRKTSLDQIREETDKGNELVIAVHVRLTCTAIKVALPRRTTNGELLL